MTVCNLPQGEVPIGRAAPTRRTQADRRARSREALLEAAARGISTYGYARLSLDRVAADAGYTRGALYHQFAGKEAVTVAVVAWIERTWQEEVGVVLADDTDPVRALVGAARGHVVYCRRQVGRVMQALRVELAGQRHPVGDAVEAVVAQLARDVRAVIAAGRRTGAIPPGPPVELLAEAYLSVMEAIGIDLAGRAPHDLELAERAVRGVLGLPSVEQGGGAAR